MLDHRWSAKVEYDYVDFGSDSPRFIGTTPGFDFNENITNHVHIVKLGMNYRFGTP